MRKSSTRVLGIDPGLGRVGFGVVEAIGSKVRLLAYGVIETPARTSTERRLLRIHERLRALVVAYHPDRMAVEELFFARNTTTAMSVGAARGVVLLAAAQSHLAVREFSPATVKQAITGYGRAEKGQVQRMLQSLFRLRRPPTPDDAADAIAVALCGLGGHP